MTLTCSELLAAEVESATPEMYWGRTRDKLSALSREQEEARIKAFVRDLLGDEKTMPSLDPTKQIDASR